jgi:hypothetical protein
VTSRRTAAKLTEIRRHDPKLATMYEAIINALHEKVKREEIASSYKSS